MRTKKDRSGNTGIGARLKAWREEKAWSQTQAAEEFGTKQRTWADWELEDGVPDFDIAAKLETMTDGRVRMIDWADVTRAIRAAKDESGTDVAATAEKAG